MTNKERLEAMTAAVAAGDMFSNFRGLIERGQTTILAAKIVGFAEALLTEIDSKKTGKRQTETQSEV